MALIRNTKRREKILDNGFQSNCGSHAKVCTNPSYIEKRAEIRHKSVMLPALQLISTCTLGSSLFQGVSVPLTAIIFGKSNISVSYLK